MVLSLSGTHVPSAQPGEAHGWLGLGLGGGTSRSRHFPLARSGPEQQDPLQAHTLGPSDQCSRKCKQIPLATGLFAFHQIFPEEQVRKKTNVTYLPHLVPTTPPTHTHPACARQAPQCCLGGWVHQRPPPCTPKLSLTARPLAPFSWGGHSGRGCYTAGGAGSV